MIVNIDNVKEFILEYGSIGELARACNIERTTLYRILSGDRNPGIKTIIGLTLAGMKKEDIFS